MYIRNKIDKEGEARKEEIGRKREREREKERKKERKKKREKDTYFTHI